MIKAKRPRIKVRKYVKIERRSKSDTKAPQKNETIIKTLPPSKMDVIINKALRTA